jgi:hypothetical protein
MGMMQSSYHDNDPTRYCVADIGRLCYENSLQFRAGIDFYAYINNNPMDLNSENVPVAAMGILFEGKTPL